MISGRKALFLVHCCIGIAGFHVPGAMAQGAKVDVCHIPPGNPDNAHTITISENALDAHLDHGDRVGACDPTQAAAGGAKVDVCHIPPGNPENAHTITISEHALGAHLDHGDHVGACDSTQTVEQRPSGDPSQTACICPRAGVWRVTNHEGWMECQPFGIKRKDKRPDKNDGAIWILNDDCSTIFSEAYERQREDVLMDRGRDCLFFGTAPGEEDGAKAIFDGAYRVETEEFITGEYYMEMSGMGADCSGYRPFEVEFLEPLSERNYARLEKRMQKELAKARETLDEHREQIEAYLEKTDGGKAFGGRNGQE
jgi:hypothetical protein